MPWYIFAISGVTINALSHVLRRKVMSGKFKVDYYTSSYLFSLTTTLALLLYVLLAGFVMPPIFDLWPVIAINIMAGVLAWITNNKGLSLLGLGEYSILMTSRQVFTWFASVLFLGIGLNLSQSIGTILILIGIIVVYANKVAFRKHDKQGILFTLITAFIYGFAILTDQIIYRQSDPISYLLIGFITTTAILVAFRPSVVRKTDLIISKKHGLNLVVFGALSAIGLALIFTSLKLADNAPLVSALFQMQTVMAVVFGIFILKERQNLASKIIGTLIATAGAILVVVS